ncbi:chemotaxis protein CheA [Nocardioides caldifontis]|uniref:chemotaxis protein CheA n=1 Tax=Nocardioides caldifontis TaxID=2588938 RepID=UPI0011E045CB|nr:chemotaxis protein CheA [Nocardioides caldifontis]
MDDLDEIVSEFLVESHENLDQLDRDLVELERDPASRELLSSVFRTLHTIKGTSGFLAFGTLESVTHVGESLLSRLRDGEMKLDPAMTTVLLEMVDAVRDLLAKIEETGAEGDDDYAELVARITQVLETGSVPAPAAAAAPVVEVVEVVEAVEVVEVVEAVAPAAADAAADEPHRRTVADSTIRVDVALLDSLMNLVGELVLTRNQMLQRAATREDIELQRTTHRLNLIAGELQEGVMKTRMQPIDNVWSKLPRVVRDLSLLLGKSVDLRMEGRDTELDKTILEAVRDPLTHLVRNSVDHGIEAPDARRAKAKPEQGVLVLRAFHEGGQVNIEIADDGAGIDPDKLREKAVDRGMMTREAAAALSDREAINLIFNAGFSTAKAVTNVSGRGVGMDVVKTNIEKIGGTIDLASTPGQGTTVRIRIPLTLAIIPALVVTAAENRYAIPQVNLLELVRLEGSSRAQVESVQGAPVYRLRGRLLPLVDLREQLDLPPVERPTTYIAVLQADNRQFGLVVDDIKDTEEIVVKPLGKQLRGIDLYAGATIMGDGNVALILDTMALARKAGMALDGRDSVSSSAAESGAAERSALLVVGLADGRRAAIPLETVDRLEEFDPARVERTGGHEVVQYRGQILPLLRLDAALHGGYGDDAAARLQVVVCHSGGRIIGVVVNAILDIVEEELAVRSHLDTGGHHGSAVVSGHVTELIDIDRAIGSFDPALLAPTH